jgi:hypothetical protein
MSDDPFVNRDQDLAEVLEILEQPRGRPLSVFVAAASGIGKSRFLDEVASQSKAAHLLRVRIRRSRGSRLENGFFLIQIAATLHKASESVAEIPSLIEFNKNLKSYLADENFGLEATDELLKELDVPLVRQIKGFLERRFSLGEFKPRELLGVNEQAAVAYLKRYIRAVVEQSDIGLIFENMHLIDEDTLAFLVETVSWPDTAVLMCEITSIEAASSANFWSFGELVEEFERAGFELKTKLLAPLSYDHFAEVASNKGVPADASLKAAYSNEAGNIRAIYNVAAVNERQRGETAKTGGDSFEQLFASLSRNEKFLSAALHTHNGSVASSHLDKFLKQAERYGIDGATVRQSLTDLSLSEVISLESGQVAFAHDSLTHALEQLVPPAMIHLAQKIWLDVYDDLAKTKTEWLFYFQLAIAHGDEHLLTKAIHRISEIVEGAHFQDQSIDALKLAAETLVQIDHPQSQDLVQTGIHQIVQTLFELEAYEQVESLLPYVRVDPQTNALLHAALASRMDQLEQVFDQTSAETIEEFPDKTGFAILRLIALATLHQRDDALSLYRDTMSIPGTTKSRYYPHLMRNTDIFLPHSESLDPIRRSAELFSSTGDQLEEAHSRNALGMQLGRLGRLSDARDALRIAEDLMDDHSSGHAQTLNNRAVVRIADGKTDEGTRMLLHLARDTVQFPFDRVVVAQNLAALAAMAEESGAETAFDTSLHLLENMSLRNLGLKRSHLWNRSQWAHQKGQQDVSEDLLNQARKLQMTHTDLWKYRLFGDPLPDEEFEFLAGQRYHFSYLSKWHFSLDLA